MDTGETVKIHKNVPAPVPVQIPKSPGKIGTENTEIGTPKPISVPIRKEEVVKS